MALILDLKPVLHFSLIFQNLKKQTEKTSDFSIYWELRTLPHYHSGEKNAYMETEKERAKKKEDKIV